ncbi:tetratricopeptide repeat protein [Microbulbifer sp. JMSA004]|uniref:tetratricopeptide repeat protein n=1 Tax=Microbulbifer sp. JMSA004 TaxID=3243370 RepID=UPI004039B020
MKRTTELIQILSLAIIALFTGTGAHAAKPSAHIQQVSQAEAQAAVEQKEYKRARALYNRLLRQQPQNYPAMIELAQLEKKLGKYKKAKQHASVVLKQNRTHRQALQLLAQIAIQQQQWAEAETYFSRLIKNHPEHGHAYLGLAQAYQAQGKDEQEQTALKDYRLWRAAQ